MISELSVLSWNFSFQTDHPTWALPLLAWPRTLHVRLWSLIDLTGHTRSLSPGALLSAPCTLGTSLSPGAVLLFEGWVGNRRGEGREGLSRDKNDNGHVVALFFCTELPYMISRKGFFFKKNLWIKYTPDIKYTGSGPELKHTQKKPQQQNPTNHPPKKPQKLMKIGYAVQFTEFPGQKKPAWIADDKEPTGWNKTEVLIYPMLRTTGLQKWVRVRTSERRRLSLSWQTTLAHKWVFIIR